MDCGWHKTIFIGTVNWFIRKLKEWTSQGLKDLIRGSLVNVLALFHSGGSPAGRLRPHAGLWYQLAVKKPVNLFESFRVCQRCSGGLSQGRGQGKAGEGWVVKSGVCGSYRFLLPCCLGTSWQNIHSEMCQLFEQLTVYAVTWWGPRECRTWAYDHS